MADATASYEYPLSPWAQRFGQSKSGAWSGMNGQDHSGLAPSQPVLDPKYYGDDGLPSGDVQPLPMPSLEELDKLYMGEDEQKLNLMGFRSWELGPLNSTLYGDISGGHRRPASAEEEQANISAFERGMIEVDESRWFPWLCRDNWWQHRVQDDERKLPGRKHWSVDDDEVWKELRIILELSNRILSLLVDTRHPLMVAAALGELDPSADPKERRIRVDPSNRDRFTVEQLRERITAMGSELIINSFILDRCSSAGPYADPTKGLMGLATFRLRALVEGDLTMAERCMAQFATAKTVINDETSREVGRSYENMVFGGHIHAAPVARHFRLGESWAEGTALSLFAEPFPGRRGLKYGQTNNLPMTEDANVVPLLWVSALLSEQFWRTEVAKHGSQALTMPRYVKTQTNYQKGRSINRPETIRVDTPLDTLRERLQTTALDFNRRYLKWTELRPWYQSEGFKWAISPWSSDTWRSSLQHFKMAHAVQNELECWRESERIMALYSDKKKTSWLYHAVGLLMKAVTPLRDVAIKPVNKGWCTEELYRSRAAEQQNPDRHRYVRFPKRRIMRNDWSYESSITMPPPSSYYLSLYQKWVDLHERLEPLPRGWHASLDEAYRLVLQSRQNDPVTTITPGAARSWGPWDFKVPPYDDRWQSWDLVPDGQGGMQRQLKDEEPPQKIDRDAREFLATNAQGEPIPYFTVSQVGEHRTAESAWIVVPRNNGLPDVYDVTEALRQLNGSTPDFRNLTRSTDIGLQLKTSDPDANIMSQVQVFLRAHIHWKMIGKLAIPQAEAAIRENDGSKGLPLYKTFGKEVYDLTRFNCPPHWKPILLGDPGGPIDETMPGFYREMVLVIDKYRCGTIVDLPSKPRAEADLTPFTERMLRWHDNPNMGVYFAVDGFVYDMSNYLDSHPGGLDSLKQYAGRDASAPFAEAHSTNPLLTSPYDSLRIGRIVPEVTFSQIQANHIVLDTWVYDVSSRDGDTNGLFGALQQLGGTDATEAMTSVDTPAEGKAALGSLKANHQSRIVARVQQAVLPVITRAELAQHGDPNDAGAWVAIGENVWDLTAMMLQPEWYAGANGSRTIDPAYAGRVMGPDAVGDETWLLQNYPHLLVAQLRDSLVGIAENMRMD
ncbi:hypothetical protein PG989_004571 [Apiospora arundinis]